MSGLRTFDDSSPNSCRRHISQYDVEQAEKTCLLPNPLKSNQNFSRKQIKSKLSHKVSVDCYTDEAAFVQLTASIKKWLSVILVSSYTLMFLSVIQAASSLFVFYQWPELKALKIAALFLGILGGSFGLVCISAVRGAHATSFLAKPHLALDNLSFFFNMGILFSIVFFGFTVCLLCINKIFWSTHILGGLFYLDNGNAVGQIRAVVIGFVVLSSASCIMSVLCMVGCILIRPNNFSPVVNGQTFLWLTLVSGICGSFTLSIAIYATTQLTHLFTDTMQNTMHSLGIALLVMSVLSLGRFALSKPDTRIVLKIRGERQASKSKKSNSWIGKVHIIALISLALVAAMVAISFLLNAQQIKPKQNFQIQYIEKMQEQTSSLLHPKDPLYTGINAQLFQEQAEKRIIEKEVEEEEEEEKILDALTKKIQYSVLGSFMLVVSLYTLADGVISSKIQRIHEMNN